jgi:hypothetical protein
LESKSLELTQVASFSSKFIKGISINKKHQF